MRPNLFEYATSELSQDAILCWLLAWANPEHQALNPSLHQVGVDLLRHVFPHSFRKVEVKRQVGKIDILCIVDDVFAILIEDKTGTIQHSEQLPRYKTHLSQKLGFSPENIFPVYIQTGDQSDYREIAEHGYRVLSRATLLSILENVNGLAAQGNSDTLADFTAYLRRIEDDVQSFRTCPLSGWTGHAWRGFYTELQSQLGAGHWSYVANPSGGFMGFYWHFVKVDGGEVYLQLEQHKLCFKIMVEVPARQAELRYHWHQLIAENAERLGFDVQRPTRFGRGTWMTVASMANDYRSTDENGLLDVQSTVNRLRFAQQVIDACVP